MKTYLEYPHTRSLFIKNEFKGSFYKWFEGLEYEGSRCGNWEAFISVTNWDDVKNSIPKSMRPLKVHNKYPFKS